VASRETTSRAKVWTALLASAKRSFSEANKSDPVKNKGSIINKFLRHHQPGRKKKKEELMTNPGWVLTFCSAPRCLEWMSKPLCGFSKQDHRKL
jgi:hypothetical protein